MGHFVSGQATQQFKDNYEKETVYWKGNKLMKYGQKLKLKYFKAELLKYEDSKFELELHQKYENRASIWYGASLAGMIYAASTEDQNLALPALSVSIGALVPFLIFLRTKRTMVFTNPSGNTTGM